MSKLTSTLILSLFVTHAHAEWSTFHGNNQRNGLTDVAGPASPVQKWAFNVGGAIITSPVIGPDGTVYVGSTWFESKKPRQYFTAIRPDGTLKWRFETPWIDDQTQATPAVAPNGNIYFGTAAGTFHCLNSIGTELWRYQAQLPVRSHTLVATDGNIYVKLDGKLFSFTPAGSVRWQKPLADNYDGGATETLEGRILIPNNGVDCYNSDGSLQWHANVGTTSAPVIVHPNGNVICSGSSIVALEPINGEFLWDGALFTYGTYATPSIDQQGNIYYGVDYDLYKLDSTGNQVFHKYLQDPNSNFLGHTWSSAAVDANNRLYWGLGNGKRSAIDYEKNLLVFNTNLVVTKYVPLPQITGTSSPAIASDGTLYVGCLDGKLYAFGN